MFPPRKLEPAGFRADYANHSDFCEILERDMQQLYLLAFLLTANHKQAEECFVSTVEEVLKERAVFKDWAQSWVKRCLIKNAIRIASPVVLPRSSEDRHFWSEGQHTTGRDSEIDVVIRLAPLERFVFVMSILERYSAWDCSMLLGCGVKLVGLAQLRALRRLPERSTSSLGFEAQTNGLQVTA
jgi:DNA-directed RNA polymerase specialized sigma24 family protein